MRADTLHRLNPKRIFYGWWLVVITGSVMVISTTPMFHAMGLWFVALESTFGWTRTQLSLAFAFTRVEGGILGPIEGYLTDRYGTKRLVMAGMAIMGVGWLLFSLVQDTKDVPYLRDLPFDALPDFMQVLIPPITFYLVYMLIALGQGIGSWLPLMAMLNNWFNRRRAMAMGFSNSTSRLGTLVLIPAIAWAIDPEFERLGWRLTVIIIGVAILVINLPLSLLIRNRPEDHGLLPDGDRPVDRAPAAGSDRTRPARPAADQADFTWQQAIRTPAFWLISVGHGCTSMILIAMMAHLAPMMVDQGYSLQVASYVITGYTVVSMVFQIIGGFIGDRVPKRLALFVFTWIQASGVFLLTFGPATSARRVWIRVAVRRRLRRTQPANRLNTRRVLRQSVLRQDNGTVPSADERNVARRPRIRRRSPRRNRRVRHSLRRPSRPKYARRSVVSAGGAAASFLSSLPQRDSHDRLRPQ